MAQSQSHITTDGCGFVYVRRLSWLEDGCATCHGRQIPSKQGIRIQFVPHGKHIKSPLRSPTSLLFAETVAVYCEDRTEHTDVLCGQTAEF
jgi:hypothetical protein